MIKRKVLFLLSLILLLLCTAVHKSSILDSVRASIAVNQVSDDVVINSLSRAVATGSAPETIVTVLFLMALVGITLSFFKKKEKYND